jgi:hypothetical protein
METHVNLKDKYGETALIQAVHGDPIGVLKLLLLKR